MPLSALGFFCEDIREEQAGTFSAIGVLPDTLRLPVMPGMLAKLGFYLRAQAALDDKLEPMTIWLQSVDGSTNKLGEFDSALIERSRREVNQAGGQFIALLFRGAAAPFPVQGYGRIQMLLRTGDQEFVTASLNIVK